MIFHHKSCIYIIKCILSFTDKDHTENGPARDCLPFPTSYRCALYAILLFVLRSMEYVFLYCTSYSIPRFSKAILNWFPNHEPQNFSSLDFISLGEENIIEELNQSEQTRGSKEGSKGENEKMRRRRKHKNYKFNDAFSSRL